MNVELGVFVTPDAEDPGRMAAELSAYFRWKLDHSRVEGAKALAARESA